MPDTDNLFAIARIQNYPAPRPERVRYAKDPQILPDGTTKFKWAPIAEAEGLAPDVAASLLSVCEKKERDGYASPDCVEPNEYYLLALEDVRRLAARTDLSPELLRDETRRLAFPRGDRIPELFQAADCILTGNLPTGDPREMEESEWDVMFREAAEPPCFAPGTLFQIKSQDVVVALCPNGRYLWWDSRRTTPRFFPAPSEVFRRLGRFLRAAGH